MAYECFGRGAVEGPELVADIESNPIVELEPPEHSLLPLRLGGGGVPSELHRGGNRGGETVRPGDRDRRREDGRGIAAAREEHVYGWRLEGVAQDLVEHLARQAPARRGGGSE